MSGQNHGNQSFRKRLLSENGDNPFSSWVDHPLSKALTRIASAIGASFVLIVAWAFLDLKSEVKGIGDKVEIILINQAGDIQRISTTSEKVREVERIAEEARRRVADMERSLYGSLRPQGDAP